ncbi:MAG: amidohydrolase family protein [Verrucomicrobiota bacterium]
MKRLADTAFAIALSCNLTAQTLQDVAEEVWNQSESVTIYPAREVITMDPEKPKAEAIAIAGDRIIGTGSVEQLQKTAGEKEVHIDRTFADHVIVPGFIAQHDHPVLTALTLASEVLAIEDWALPSGTIPAVKDKKDFLTRLVAADKKLEDPKEPLVSWGYHPGFFGKLTRADLDKHVKDRPVIIWGRSCHEFFLNTAAMEAGGITKEFVDGWSVSEKEQSNFEEGHFWEQGAHAVMHSKLATMVATPERLEEGLTIARDYMHAKGITFGNEPGGIMVKPIQDGVNKVFSQESMPFRWSFMVDGKTVCDKEDDDSKVIAKSEEVASWYYGKTSQAPKMVKLFSDGAIYSLLMQLREPYLDKHEGAWMTDLKVFQRAFRIYWDAGYQIHIHVNGDAGLDRLLDALEENMARNPREDHRTTVVHFAVSAKDQVERIKKLGAIVSANPYYVRALADQYSKVGLGPERANSMVRMGDVEKAGISYSYHSDMPMAPCDPLFLMWCGVVRETTSGRIAAPEQRVSREGALKAVTINAAYSLKMEDEIGSIEPGKLANLTILDDNPLTCDPMTIKDIGVWGTLNEGRVLQVSPSGDTASNRTPTQYVPLPLAFAAPRPDPIDPLDLEALAGRPQNCSSCSMNRLLGTLMAASAKDW